MKYNRNKFFHQAFLFDSAWGKPNFIFESLAEIYADGVKDEKKPETSCSVTTH